MDRREPGGPTDNDADLPARGSSDPEAITEHLRCVWLAGARNITVTSADEVVRHRAYLAHRSTDI